MLIQYTFASLFYSLFNLSAFTSILRLIEVIASIMNNINYVLLLLILILIEVFYLLVMDMKILILFQSFLLLLYTWSIEIPLIYMVLSYVCIKFIKGYGLERKFLTEIGSIKSWKAPLKMLSGIRISRNGLILIVIGTSLGLHILYSNFTKVSNITLLLYLIILSLLCVIRNREKYIDINSAINMMLASIPPFGVTILLYSNQ